MSETGEQRWAELVEALKEEVAQVGGFGDVTVTITFHSGTPRDIRVRERLPHYRLGTLKQGKE